jgi:hypothetical protein
VAPFIFPSISFKLSPICCNKILAGVAGKADVVAGELNSVFGFVTREVAEVGVGFTVVETETLATLVVGFTVVVVEDSKIVVGSTVVTFGRSVVVLVAIATVTEATVEWDEVAANVVALLVLSSVCILELLPEWVVETGIEDVALFDGTTEVLFTLLIVLV